MLGLKQHGKSIYRFYSGDLQGPENHFDMLSFVQGAPSLLKNLVGDVTTAAVGALIVPYVRKRSGPHESQRSASTAMSRLCSQMDVKSLK